MLLDHDKEILCTRDKYPRTKIRTQTLTKDGPAGAAQWTWCDGGAQLPEHHGDGRGHPGHSQQHGGGGERGQLGSSWARCWALDPGHLACLPCCGGLDGKRGRWSTFWFLIYKSWSINFSSRCSTSASPSPAWTSSSSSCSSSQLLRWPGGVTIASSDRFQT